jgi:hypothetical protein
MPSACIRAPKPAASNLESDFSPAAHRRTVALTDKSKRASWSQVGARDSDRARAVSDVDVSEQLHLGVWQASERSIKASCYFDSMWAILRDLTTACVVVA